MRPVLIRLLAVCCVPALLLLGEASAAAPAKGDKKAAPPAPQKAEAPKAPAAPKPSAGAPLPPGEKAAWSHAPFEAGDCSICHERNDAKNPGKLVKAVNDLCFSCHEELQAVMTRKFTHMPVEDSCTNCHNAHNAPEKKLLLAEQSKLCLDCHDGIKDTVEKAKVKHDALTLGAKCANCHNPHAANVEKLLVQLPFDLCVSCHSQEGLADDKGVKMTNFKEWLGENKVWHGPVEAKDCSACHKTHGGDNFRLLKLEYPAKFYSGYDPKNYALCYDCHNDKVMSAPETTTLTSFRDGSRNLHYVHVNKAERGRTCRACHEVHASKQDHQIRDGVPYGPKGWMLKINFTKTATGGQCAKTCHETKSYTNKALAGATPPKK